jgi:hypothetical protein
MKPSNIVAIAGIAAAGLAAYFVVRKFQGAGDSIGSLFDKAKELAGDAIEEVAVIGRTVAAGPGAVLDDQGYRVPVADQLATSGGIGLKATSGSYISQATRNALTQGSMLLSDAEKAAIRAADSGNPSAKAASIYGLFNQNDFNRIDGFLTDSYNPNTASFSLIN